LQLEQLRELKDTFAQVARDLEKTDKVKVGEGRLDMRFDVCMCCRRSKRVVMRTMR
jgi:hypothetical protein